MAWKRIKENLWGNPNKGISGEPAPHDLTLENAYKTRWIWYHSILGIELLIVIIVQVAILTLLAVKL